MYWAAGDGYGLAAVRCAPGEVHVWRIELDCAATSVDALRAMSVAEELERAARFRSPELRERWTVARGALRCILAIYSRSWPSTLVFRLGRTETGVSPAIGKYFLQSLSYPPPSAACDCRQWPSWHRRRNNPLGDRDGRPESAFLRAWRI